MQSSRAPKWDFAVGPTRRGEGTKIVAIAAWSSRHLLNQLQ
jgi:hypothetical protein